MVKDVLLVLNVPPPVCAPVSEYVIDCTPDGDAAPPESFALRFTLTLNRYQPFAFGDPAFAFVVGGVVSPGLIVMNAASDVSKASFVLSWAPLKPSTTYSFWLTTPPDRYV